MFEAMADGATAAPNYGGTILRLEVENFKRIEVVDITPAPVGALEICGRNGAGKSSVLDAIDWILRGNATLPDVPIRAGALRARGAVKFGGVPGMDGLTIERTLRPSGAPTLKITTAKGAAPKRPQEILDGLISPIAFDPFAFELMEPREQKAALIELCGLAPKLAEMAAKRAELIAARSEMRKAADAAERAIAAVGDIPDGLPEAPISEATAAEAMNAAAAVSRANAERRAAAAGLQANLAANEAALARLESEADALRKELAAVVATISATQSHLEELRAAVAVETAAVAELRDVDTATLEAALAEINRTNADIARRARRDELTAQYTAALQAANAADAGAKEIDAETAALLGSDAMPVAGLGFSENGVLFNGLPLEQASASERLRVSMSIAMESNPAARVILIRAGSLLDDDAMAYIHETAKARGFQVWIERVGDAGESGILIEEGRVAQEPTDGK